MQWPQNRLKWGRGSKRPASHTPGEKSWKGRKRHSTFIPDPAHVIRGDWLRKQPNIKDRNNRAAV